MFETSLGTLDQLRIELESNFTSRRVKLQVEKTIHLDTMVILPLIKDETARSKDMRARSLEQQLEDKDANVSRDNSLRYSNFNLRSNDTTLNFESVTVCIMCQPNA